MSKDVETYISTLVAEQFPDFYKTEGPDFVQFLRAYYEWQESNRQFIADSRNLFEYGDIDDTLDDFVQYFVSTYMNGIPKRVLGDKRFLQKHILDLYRSKGSIEGLKLLFRLLYNEDVSVYIPSYDILKTSDGKWTEKQYIEISYSQYNSLFQNQVVTGQDSGATATVDTYESRVINGRRVYILFVSNVSGTFQHGELVLYAGLAPADAPVIIGSPNQFNVTSSDSGFSLGDTITFTTNATFIGTGMKFVVSGVRNTQDGIIIFTLEDGGLGYSLDANVQITSGTNTAGSGADFVVTAITNTSIYTYNSDLIAPYANVPLDANDYGFPPGGAEIANTLLADALTYANVEVGTISAIQTTNEGTGYDGTVTVTITDPYTSGAGIPDGNGSFWGLNANVSGVADFGSGKVTSVRLVDSGFGYYTNNQLAVGHLDSNTFQTVSGNVILSGLGKAEGFWENSDGFLNSDKYLQDSYYYQEFSYEVQTPRALSRYVSIVKQLTHPVGNEIFGRPSVCDIIDNTVIVAQSINAQFEVFPVAELHLIPQPVTIAEMFSPPTVSLTLEAPEVDIVEAAIIGVDSANVNIIPQTLSVQEIIHIQQAGINIVPQLVSIEESFRVSEAINLVPQPVTIEEAMNVELAGISIESANDVTIEEIGSGPTVTLENVSALAGYSGWSGTSSIGTQPFGAEQTGRVIALAIAWARIGLARSLDSVTIAGGAATRAVRAGDGNFSENAEIWYRQLDSGTSGEIVLNFSGTGGSDNGRLVGIYSIRPAPGSNTVTLAETDVYSFATASATQTVATAGAGIFAGVKPTWGNTISFSGGDVVNDGQRNYSVGSSPHAFVVASSAAGDADFTLSEADPDPAGASAFWV